MIVRTVWQFSDPLTSPSLTLYNYITSESSVADENKLRFISTLKPVRIRNHAPRWKMSSSRSGGLLNRGYWLAYRPLRKYRNILCLSPQILHKALLPVSLETSNDPKRKQKQCLSKIWGDKQRVLWYFPKWPIETWQAQDLYSKCCCWPQQLHLLVYFISHVG